MHWIKLYCVLLVFFPLCDFLWLRVFAKNLYQEHIGLLISTQIRWGAVALFYLLYIFSLLVFVISPAINKESGSTAFIYGSLFGLMCYGTYNLTNLATLKGWSIYTTFYDMAWGTIISGTLSLLAFYLQKYL